VPPPPPPNYCGSVWCDNSVTPQPWSPQCTIGPGWLTW
jgi:hypothetical protein